VAHPFAKCKSKSLLNDVPHSSRSLRKGGRLKPPEARAHEQPSLRPRLRAPSPYSRSVRTGRGFWGCFPPGPPSSFSCLTNLLHRDNIIIDYVSSLITAGCSSSLTTRRVALGSHLLGFRFFRGSPFNNGRRVPARAAAAIVATVR
jgi:hypothetical protein